MRNWAYAIANRQYLRMLMMQLLKRQIAHYDIIWYMTVPYEERMRRHDDQLRRHENPDKLERRFRSKRIFELQEMHLTKILSRLNIEKVFDTAHSGCDEIVDSGLSRFAAGGSWQPVLYRFAW
jgi:hypothetical protein